jgi:hypothetical protein
MIEIRSRPAEGGEHGIGPGRVGAPGLLGVVRRPGVQHHLRTVGEQPSRNGAADADPPARAGHQCDAARQRPHRSGIVHPPILGHAACSSPAGVMITDSVQ